MPVTEGHWDALCAALDRPDLTIDPRFENNDTRELYHDPHLLSRGFVHELDLPVHGKVPMLGFAPRLSASQVEMSAPPLLGEHTDEVLVAGLGLSEDDLAAMRESGVIGDRNRYTG